jgi:hypothetical protein
MYTFDDWVFNPKFQKILEEKPFDEICKELRERKEIDINIQVLILEAKEETYDRAFKMGFFNWTHAINNGLKSVFNHVDKIEFVKNELRLLENEKSQNLRAYNQALTNLKCFKNITPIDYQTIKDHWERKEHLFNCTLNIPDADKLNFRMYLLIEQIHYLENKLDKFKTVKAKSIDENLSLINVLKPGIKPEIVIENYRTHFSKYDTIAYLLKYLRHLINKGYYIKGKISWPETFIIARNDFGVSASKVNRKYTPPLITEPEYNEDPWKHIPNVTDL